MGINDKERENEAIMNILVKMRENFVESDERLEGHGMEDAVSDPLAVAEYALNKYNRMHADLLLARKALNSITGLFEYGNIVTLSADERLELIDEELHEFHNNSHLDAYEIFSEYEEEIERLKEDEWMKFL